MSAGWTADTPYEELLRSSEATNLASSLSTRRADKGYKIGCGIILDIFHHIR